MCQRAEDIWEDTVLINDVVALIARSKVVICDVTGCPAPRYVVHAGEGPVDFESSIGGWVRLM